MSTRSKRKKKEGTTEKRKKTDKRNGKKQKNLVLPKQNMKKTYKHIKMLQKTGSLQNPAN